MAEGIVEAADLFTGKIRQIKWFDVFFVDDDGLPVPNVSFEVIYASGEKKVCQADANGYFKDDKAVEGQVKIKMQNGSIIESYGNFSDFSEDDADPDNTGEDKIEYIVRKRDTLSKIARRLGVSGGWQTLYNTTAPDGTPNFKRLRSGNPNRIYPGETIWVPTNRRVVRVNTKNAAKAITKVRIRGKQRDEMQIQRAVNWAIYHARYESERQAADNLLIAAGWDESNNTLNIKKLCDILKPVLKLNRPGIGDKWNLYVIQGNIMKYYDNSGNFQYQFNLNCSPIGQAGAYTFYEVNGMNLLLAIYDNTSCLGDPAKPYVAEFAESIEGEEARQKWNESNFEIDAASNTWNFKKLPVIYQAPSTKGSWQSIVLEGGNGVLEDYIGDSDYQAKVHERNLAVLETYGRNYRGFLNNYIRIINVIPSSQGEDALREKGPPPEPYPFPLPVGATQKQEWDLTEKMNECSSYSAWLAVSDKIYEMDNYRWPSSSSQHREGAVFFRPKLTLQPSAAEYINTKIDNLAEALPVFGRLSSYGDVKLEWNFDIGTDGFKLGSSKSVVFKKEGNFVAKEFKLSGGEEVEIDDSGGKKVTFKIGYGDYGLEASTDGEFKLTGPSGATAYVNPKTAEMGFGVNIPIPGLGSVYVGIGMVGLRSETVLVYLSGAPGFFERKSPDTLVKTAWANLEYWEKLKLEILGWNQEIWDIKDELEYSELPNSVKADLDSLSPAEYIAGLHLGFQGRWAGNWVDFWKKKLPAVEGVLTFKPVEVRVRQENLKHIATGK